MATMAPIEPSVGSCVAAAQLARFYKTPSHTTAPNSDNHAHDEQNAARVGDAVIITECRPLSKMKRWRMVEVVSAEGAPKS
jgi:ribosomal protein S17